MSRAKAGTITVALTFIGFGVALLLQQFGLWQWDLLKYAGPLVLIALGLEIIVMRALNAGAGLRYSGFSFVVAALAVLVSLGYSGVTTFAPGFFGPVFFGPAHIVAVNGELPVEAGVTRVEVELPVGRVIVTGGDSGAVRYDGNLLFYGEASAQADAEQTLQWTAARQGDTLVLRQARPPGWRGNVRFGWPGGRPQLHVEVPAGLEVSVRTSNSSVEADRLTVDHLTLWTSNAKVRVDEVTGPVLVKTSNADVTVRQIGGAVDVTTSNGSVNLADIGGAADVTTSNGSITATSPVLGDWRLSTSNASITMNVPTDTDAALQASTSNAKVGGNVQWRTSGRETSGSATLGAGTHRVTLGTSNGSIRVNAGH